ncbi:recombinase RecA [Mycoplasmoides gallisepticum]|uniref:recombinase RecA n=1 Tax=Mycoplasmoides gallisepticum TaxID=2096 RepID=UPI0012469C0C|nr:recombinase RecA [Mycoplasmoides gallisepticum]QEX47399.1 recombinase RecA [Mycoplasmoides gallisepticum]ULH62010.1 recombinase RecA [Mycoplasmoides gallisepticum]ULH68078.1 recombinase RecA [Mycoplasmoides gallisepticum]WGG24467.1 recombinase RecA [Mycoplasmoides gallisepticum]WGG25224.1 recombinase RecA [Mycoplasmoides gallisepticum]
MFNKKNYDKIMNNIKNSKRNNDRITNVTNYDVLKLLQQKFGKTNIYLNEKDELKDLEAISTGSIKLDHALGTDGFIKGRIVEIYGNESCGKTTLALSTIKQAIDRNMRVAFIDAEHALDLRYVKRLGIDLTKLIIARPDYGEQGFEIIKSLIKTELIDLIVVDSVAALVPKVEIEGKMEDQTMGTHARMMSRGLSRIQPLLAKHNVSVIFINQLREKVGIMFGNPEVTTGGKALKFYSSTRLELRRAEIIKDAANNAIGIRSKATITKNKLSTPMTTTYIDFYFKSGISEVNEIIDLAIDYQIIEQSGSWFSYQKEKIAQGKANLITKLGESEELYKLIKTEVLNKLKDCQ